MKIERKFTTEATGAYGTMSFAITTSEIRNPDGKVVFRNEAVEVPEGWSQVASDVLAQKYFRKAGVPAVLKRVKEKGVPEFLWRSIPDAEALAQLPEDQRFCRTNMQQSRTWRMPWKDTPLIESGLLGPVQLVWTRQLHVPQSGQESR